MVSSGLSPSPYVDSYVPITGVWDHYSCREQLVESAIVLMTATLSEVVKITIISQAHIALIIAVYDD
jgi:hypothetical protein